MNIYTSLSVLTNSVAIFFGTFPTKQTRFFFVMNKKVTTSSYVSLCKKSRFCPPAVPFSIYGRDDYFHHLSESTVQKCVLAKLFPDSSNVRHVLLVVPVHLYLFCYVGKKKKLAEESCVQMQYLLNFNISTMF